MILKKSSTITLSTPDDQITKTASLAINECTWASEPVLQVYERAYYLGAGSFRSNAGKSVRRPSRHTQPYFPRPTQEPVEMRDTFRCNPVKF